MTTAERLALNNLVANKRFYDAIADNNNVTSTGTQMGIDGATGRALITAADGIVRTNSIASSSQLGMTSGFVGGSGGNAGFSDGQTAN